MMPQGKKKAKKHMRRLSWEAFSMKKASSPSTHKYSRREKKRQSASAQSAQKKGCIHKSRILTYKATYEDVPLL